MYRFAIDTLLVLTVAFIVFLIGWLGLPMLYAAESHTVASPKAYMISPLIDSEYLRLHKLKKKAQSHSEIFAGIFYY